MGEYDKALIIYETMLDKATGENNLELMQATHYQIAELFMIYKKDWSQGKVHLKKMFCVKIMDLHEVVDEVRSDLINIWSAMRNLFSGDQIDENEVYSSMAELLNQVNVLYLDHSAKSLSPLNYQFIVDRYNYIGWILEVQNKLSEALVSHEQALRILREHLPPTHPRLAMTCYNIGLLHLKMNNYLSALDCVEKALDIQEKALQPNHPHFAETHFHLSIILEHLDRVDDALQHARKAIDIGRHTFVTSNEAHMKKYQEQLEKILLLTQSCNELVL
jgi:tetratricopeptide (TPR) repeat protein